jgi:hypothetical protein
MATRSSLFTILRRCSARSASTRSSSATISMAALNETPSRARPSQTTVSPVLRRTSRAPLPLEAGRISYSPEAADVSDGPRRICCCINITLTRTRHTAGHIQCRPTGPVVEQANRTMRTVQTRLELCGLGRMRSGSRTRPKPSRSLSTAPWTTCRPRQKSSSLPSRRTLLPATARSKPARPASAHRKRCDIPEMEPA